MNLADLAELAKRTGGNSLGINPGPVDPRHWQIEQVRNSIPPTAPEQVPLAEDEHKAFAKEWTLENPALALPSLLFGIPMYSGAKAVGLIKGRTPASLGEMAAGYRGMGEGINYLIDSSPRLRSLLDALQGSQPQ